VPNVERLIDLLRNEFSRPPVGPEVPQATGAVLGLRPVKRDSPDPIDGVEAHTHVVPKRGSAKA
jgi:hypothetical protein